MTAADYAGVRGRLHAVLRVTPSKAVGALVLAQLLVWTLFPYILATSMDIDVVADGMSWGHEWQWGYYKHPPLPSWLVEVFFNGFGDLGPFLLSELGVALAYVFIFLLGRSLMDERKAAVGTLLLAAVYHFGVPSSEWNHNTAQIPFWAAIAFTYWKAYSGRGLGWWPVLGLLAALGMLTKYSTAMLLTALVCHLLCHPNGRRHLRTIGPYAALVVFVLVLAPHGIWLVHNNFPTFTYAEAQAGHAGNIAAWLFTPVLFLAAQVFFILPAYLIALYAGLLRAGERSLPRFADETDRFLLFIGIGPLLITALVSFATGLGIRYMWGFPMLNLAGLILVRLAGRSFEHFSFERLGVGIALCFLVYPIGYLLTTDTVPSLLEYPSRMQWPEREIAAKLDEVWTRETHAPLRIVAGGSWMAGLVAMRPPRPSVFVDADFKKAPWITPARLQAEGALIVWQEAPLKHVSAAERREQRAIAAYAAGAPLHGTLRFSWPQNPDLAPLVVGWAVLPPGGAQR